MQNKTIQKTKSLLESGNIRDALIEFISIATQHGCLDLLTKASTLLADFGYMLSYFIGGAKDPTRDKMLARIYDELYTLLDTFIVRTDNIRCYSSITGIDLENMQSTFNAIVNNFPATREDCNLIQEIILDEKRPLYYRTSMLSALMLNLIKFFDNDKFESLYIYTLEDQHYEIRVRAWVAIVFVSMIHNHRISTQPRLVEQLRLECEEGMNVEGVNVFELIQKGMFLCLETQKARAYFKNVLQKDLENKYSEIQNISEQNKNADKYEIESQMQEILDNSGIQDKIGKFIDMHKEGVDIMFDMFAQLSHYDFFKQECNWFSSYESKHPAIQGILKQNQNAEQYIKIIERAGSMCNTDKYGNSFMALLISNNKSNDQIINQLSQLNINAEDVVSASLSDTVINYLHDLARYYGLFFINKKNKPENPFNGSILFNKYFGLDFIFETEEMKNDLVDFLIKHEYYDEARTLLNQILKEDKTEKILKKLAYCIIKANKYEEAELCNVLDLYNEYYPGNKWAIKAYAKALNTIYNYNKAENLLREGCNLFPEDTTMLVLLANTLIKEQRYEEALKYLFKADILNENDYETCSNIAFCSLALGNKDNASKYIEKVLLMPNISAIDYINAGHIALLNGDIESAINRYRFVETEEMKQHFIYDNDMLIRAGIKQEVITLTFQAILFLEQLDKKE